MLENPVNEKNAYLVNKTDFFAEIELILYEGEGCGCAPLEGILIFALGHENDHNDSAYTDENGSCTLVLEIDERYRVMINEEDYENALFDFLVVGDQDFTFHLKEIEVSVSQDISESYKILQKTTISTLQTE